MVVVIGYGCATDDLGAALKFFRTAADVTQVDAAEAMGIGQPFLSALEGGKFGSSLTHATQCTLSGSGPSASGTVSYKESAGGPKNGQTITADYVGDTTHQDSAGSATLT